MKTVSSIVAAGLLASLATGLAVAQPKTREEVRPEAASAARAGQIDRGEVTTVRPAQSVKAGPEVKAETRAAVKARAIDQGEVTRAPAPKPSAKTRAEVKAEAASAIRPKPVMKVEDSSAKKQ